MRVDMKIIKTLVTIFMALAIVLTFVPAVQAAGSDCNITTPMISRDFNTLVVYVSCVADYTNGTVPVQAPRDVKLLSCCSS